MSNKRIHPVRERPLSQETSPGGQTIWKNSCEGRGGQEEQPVKPIVEGQMELEDDSQMMEVANILVDMSGKMQGKKKRKTYAATYRKGKAAKKKAMKEGDVENKDKNGAPKISNPTTATPFLAKLDFGWYLEQKPEIEDKNVNRCSEHANTHSD
ncbi:hypothetical protein CAEBREN_06536 [Caenorhabditis brenneri]|uniref:Uncharacterized protein n=1 Tax=Caenorhabditis brenneri TaxID=135651 RepID=G0ND39_CAEBE|nr:hypothetical protein CAEBREN_06536 [Caenorhabditis brenneri]